MLLQKISFFCKIRDANWYKVLNLQYKCTCNGHFDYIMEIYVSSTSHTSVSLWKPKRSNCDYFTTKISSTTRECPPLYVRAR